MSPEKKTAKKPAPEKQPAGRKPRERRSRGLLSVAVEIDALVSPIAKRQGFAMVNLMQAWPEIIGSELARQCRPQRLTRGPEGRDGTLHLGVSGPLALELQHLTPQLLERINAHYGYRAVARIALHQTAPLKQPTRRRTPPAQPKSLETPADLAARAAAIDDPDLRQALLDLGRSVHGKEKDGSGAK